MSTQMQLRGGTTAENLLFTGAQREVTVDTDLKTLYVHDGVTAGGYPLASGRQLKNGTFYYNEDAGSAADAYILVPKATTNVPTGYIDGVQFGFVSVHANSGGGATANFQGLGVKNLKYPGGIDPAPGDIFGRVTLIFDSGNDWLEIQRKPTTAQQQLPTLTGTVSSGALTLGLAPRSIDFRSSTLGSGVVNTRNVTSALSLVIPSGATLGTVNAVAARLVLIAIDFNGTVELAFGNLAGAVNIDETVLISTLAITAGSAANNIYYSTTARTNVPFRVVGLFDSTQATAGLWSTAPTKIQGAGGAALLSCVGVGRTYKDVTASRAFAGTYTNTTGRDIVVSGNVNITASATITLSVGGVVVWRSSGTNAPPNTPFYAVIPQGQTYTLTLVSGTATIQVWMELS